MEERIFSKQMEELWRNNAERCDKFKMAEDLVRRMNAMADEWESRGGYVSLTGCPVCDYTFNPKGELRLKDFQILLDDYLGDTEYLKHSHEDPYYIRHEAVAERGKLRHQITIYVTKEFFKGCIKIKEEVYVPATTKVNEKVLCAG